MESSPLVFESLSHPGALPNQDSPFQSECLVTALELLEILREEAEILKRFAGAEPPAACPKERVSGQRNGVETPISQRSRGGIFTASESFKVLLGEISQLNASNGAFIEKTLSYWQDLLSIFLPPSYGPAGKTAMGPARSLRGLSFRREI